MNIQMLQEFVILAKRLNFSVAANESHISQPTLSTHIKRLEQEIGFPLFERGAKLSLTPAGSEFLISAQDVLSTLESALAKCRILAAQAPPVRITTVAGKEEFESRLLAASGVAFTFVAENTDGPLLSNIINDRCDIEICYDYRGNRIFDERLDAAGIITEPLPWGSGPLSFFVKKGHPVSSLDRLTRDALRNQTVVIGNGAHFDTWRTLLDSLFGKELDLKYILSDSPTFENGAPSILERAIHVCAGDNAAYASSPDIVKFSQLDDVEVFFPTVFAYKPSCKNERVAVLVEHLRNCSRKTPNWTINHA